MAGFKNNSSFSGGVNIPELDFVVSRLINQNQAAEGTSLPPKQQGEFRVPIVTNLKIIKTAAFFGGTEFTLSWVTPDLGTKNISQYNVYALGTFNNRVPVGPFTTKTSPSTIRVTAPGDLPVTIIVQTVLRNGQVSDLNRSPAVTGVTLPAALDTSDFAPGTVPIDALENNADGSLITWNSSGQATLFGPGAADSILVGQGAGAEPTFKTRTTLDLVEGRSALTTVGELVEISASGIVQEANILTSDVAAVITEAVRDAANLTTVSATTVVSAVGEITETSEILVEGTVATTDATPTTIYTLAIPATTTVGFSGTVVARRTGGSAGTAEDGAFYTIVGVYKNVAGTATVVGLGPTITAVGEDQALWDVTFNPTGANVQIQVTGTLNNNINWSVTLRTYSIS